MCRATKSLPKENVLFNNEPFRPIGCLLSGENAAEVKAFANGNVNDKNDEDQSTR